MLGVADDHIVLGGNRHPFASTTIDSVLLWAWAKDALYGNSGLTTHSIAVPNARIHPQPLHLTGRRQNTWPNQGDHVYALADLDNGGDVEVLRWDIGDSSISAMGIVDLAATGSPGAPVSAPQLDGDDVTAGDSRPRGFHYRNGYGWTVTSASCDPGDGAVDCLRFAQIDLSTYGLGPAGLGLYGTNDLYRLYPALAANRCGDLAIAFSYTRATGHIGLAVSTRAVFYDPGDLIEGGALKEGEVPFDQGFGGSPHRWGEQTGAAISPNGELFWIFGAYAKDLSSPNWGTWAAAFTLPTCEGAIFHHSFETGNTSGWSNGTP